ncbi:MAG: hypothetical protein CL917_06840 [Deltaproteobacteria bacterium]|nr:hypothetical protein [Deltaproteobacteria bacterium]
MHPSRCLGFMFVKRSYLREFFFLSLILSLLAMAPSLVRGQTVGSQSEVSGLRAKAAQAESQGQFLSARALYAQAVEKARGQASLEVESLLDLARCERAVGEVPSSMTHLERALTISDERDLSNKRPAIEASLGASALALGERAQATLWLTRAIHGARTFDQVRVTAEAENDLGVLAALKGLPEDALAHFEASALAGGLAQDSALEARALGNAARVSAPSGPERAQSFLKEAALRVETLPPSYVRAELWVNLGHQERSLGVPSAESRVLASQWLYAGLETADEVGAESVATVALRELGALYQMEGRRGEALELTNRALRRARRIADPVRLYRLESQRGELLNELGRRPEAISAYSRAIEALAPLRTQTPWGGDGQGASFEQEVQPIYEAFVGLLLDQAQATSDSAVRQSLLRRARDGLERFKAAELRDYFQDECVDALQDRLASIEAVSPEAAILYPVSLADRLVVLVSWPTGEIVAYEKAVSRALVETEVALFRQTLERAGTRRYLPHAQRLYTWLIEPLKGALQEREIKTLVFVPSGALLTIPMAALHDGQSFLVDHYAVALTPGLQLTDPRPFQKEGPRALLAGLSEATDGFAPLPNVALEIEEVHSVIGGDVLMNAAFRRSRLRERLAEEPYSVVHLATHAVFSGLEESAFLVTADGRLSMKGLAEDIGTFRFREQPLELLTLSACETAEGNPRAALGLSGIAVQSGARSALGSLWSVDDPATARLVTAFYRHLLTAGVSRAEALAQAQRELRQDFRYRHPAFWAPFQMIGSWL